LGLLSVHVAQVDVAAVHGPEASRQRSPACQLEDATVLAVRVCDLAERRAVAIPDPHPEIALALPVRLSQPVSQDRLQRDVEVRPELYVAVDAGLTARLRVVAADE
jgi:hypothetical protein